MLGELVFEERIPRERQAVVTRSRSTTWDEFRTEATRLAQIHQLLAKRRIGLCFGPTAAAMQL